MKLTYGELIEELQERPADELMDIAEVAKKYAIEKEREEIRRLGQQNMNDYLAGRIDDSASDIDQFFSSLDRDE